MNMSMNMNFGIGGQQGLNPGGFMPQQGAHQGIGGGNPMQMMMMMMMMMMNMMQMTQQGGMMGGQMGGQMGGCGCGCGGPMGGCGCQACQRNMAFGF